MRLADAPAWRPGLVAGWVGSGGRKLVKRGVDARLESFRWSERLGGGLGARSALTGKRGHLRGLDHFGLGDRLGGRSGDVGAAPGWGAGSRDDQARPRRSRDWLGESRGSWEDWESCRFEGKPKVLPARIPDGPADTG